MLVVLPTVQFVAPTVQVVAPTVQVSTVTVQVLITTVQTQQDRELLTFDKLRFELTKRDLDFCRMTL